MPESTTPDLASIKPAMVPGLSTTAQLLISLTKTYFDVPDMPYDSTLARSASIYAEFSQLFEKLITVADNASIRSTTEEVLAKLKTVSTPSAKATYETASRDAGPVLEHSVELAKRAELFRKSFYEDRDKTFDALRNLLRAVAENPDKKGSQEILNQLITAEKTRKSLEAELNKLRESRLVSDRKLADILNVSLRALPPKEQESVSSQVSDVTRHLRPGEI